MKKQELEELLKKQEERFTKIEEALATLLKSETEKVKEEVKELPKEEVKEPPKQEFPVPLEYQEITSTILNKKFSISVNPLSDRPMFEFVVSVPKEYSNAPEPHWLTYKADLRPKVITYAEGVNGVREWIQKVFNNFDQDTRTRIILDRARV